MHQELESQLSKELDFLIEASNARRTADLLRSDTVEKHMLVPEVYRPLSTKVCKLLSSISLESVNYVIRRWLSNQ